MKRLIAVFAALIMTFGLVSCDGGDNQKADETAYAFIEAMLVRDEETMKQFIHPDYVETAMPDDEFYESLQKDHFFTLGHKLDMLEASGKQSIEDTSFEGDLMQCVYLARTNELFYDMNILILSNEKGYGVVAVSASLNTEALYHAITNDTLE